MFSLTGCGNLLLQPLRLFEISLRETNGSLAGHWSSVTTDKGDDTLLAIDFFSPLKAKAKVLPAALRPSTNLMIMRNIVQDLGVGLFFISYTRGGGFWKVCSGEPPFQNATSRLDAVRSDWQ